MTADPGLGAPGADLTQFPRWTLTPDAPIYRAVTADRAPWWFGSDGTQRFDLAPPRGTCYVAMDIETAIREKGRRSVLSKNVLDPAFLASFEVYELRLPARVSLADTSSAEAVRFGINREISTIEQYRLTCQWAEAFDMAGFDGIRYASRFTSSAAGNAVAVFGQQGNAEWPHVRKLSGVEAARRAGMDSMIAVPPLSKTATMARPPES
ncbi:MAG: RES family NAD+ phosphorylase [Actinomycetota bacterium]|nr:RES family NAD+ phosphorylase [Actinomycetota bacterium]